MAKNESGPFEKVSLTSKKKIIDTWKFMNEEDKEHFVNQVGLSLTVWGTDGIGKEMVAKIIELLINDGSKNLADFGIYIDRMVTFEDDKEIIARNKEIAKAIEIVDEYRLKYEMGSESHKTAF